MRPVWLFILFGLLVLASRWPLAPGQLFSFDDVNFAYALGDFDVRSSQPHPPGYPLFVAQARVLEWLRFKRPESIFFALSILGSTAALVVLATAGNRILGGDSGWHAAWLLLLHPSFWYGTLTSAVRPQLALVSICVAAACHRAWSGERPWVYWSAGLLAAGAGVRPETGPLLFPLWLAAAVRSGAGVPVIAKGIAVLAIGTAIWLIPTMVESGGPAEYVRVCFEYLADQASLTSPVFGATTPRWQTTLWWLAVWTCAGVLAWPLPLAVATPRFRKAEVAFLALWIVPLAVFAAFVHVADPGQTLAIGVPVCLVGGRLVSDAANALQAHAARWRAFAFMLMPAVFVLLFLIFDLQPQYALLAVPLLCAASGILAMCGRLSTPGVTARAALSVFLILPAVLLSAFVFFTPVWYTSGPLSGIVSGFASTSLGQIRATLSVDDANLRAVQQLAKERAGQSAIVWERGSTAWRKVSWYAPSTPLVVLERRTLHPDAPVVMSRWEGPRLVSRAAGNSVRLQVGTRVIWLVRQDELAGLARQIEVRRAGAVGYSDLPNMPGSVQVGAYRVEW